MQVVNLSSDNFITACHLPMVSTAESGNVKGIY